MVDRTARYVAKDGQPFEQVGAASHFAPSCSEISSRSTVDTSSKVLMEEVFQARFPLATKCFTLTMVTLALLIFLMVSQ